MAGARAEEQTKEHSRVAVSPMTADSQGAADADGAAVAALPSSAAAVLKGPLLLLLPLLPLPLLLLSLAHHEQLRHLHIEQCTLRWPVSQNAWHMGWLTSSTHRDEHSPPTPPPPLPSPTLPPLAAPPPTRGSDDCVGGATSPAVGAAGLKVPPQATQPLHRHVLHASAVGRSPPHSGCSQLSNVRSPGASDVHAEP